LKITANDARGNFVARIDPRQQLLHLEKPKRIIAARHVEMGYVNIQRHSANEDASNQRDHVAGLIIQVGTLDHGEAREQRLGLDF